VSHDPFPFPESASTTGRRGSTAQDRAARKRRARRRRRTLIALTVVLAFTGVIAVAAGDNLRGIMGSLDVLGRAAAADFDGPSGEPVYVEIPSGASGTVMGRLLYEAGVVASVAAFTQAFEAHPQAAGIQPGLYRLPTRKPAADAVVALVGGARAEASVTFPEGFRVEQVVDRLEARTHLTREELEAALSDPASFGLPPEAGGEPEGWLFPATYIVRADDSATDVLGAMVARTVRELDSHGVPVDQRARVLNIASMIEREVRHDEDLPKVARAIENRLDRGMLLQIDAAVAYGLGISGTQLTRAHLRDASNPFNTYQHLGLPPTPIANPGTAAIRAAMYPAEGSWIFWVTVNLDTGETIFTSTYADHQRYVAQLRAWQRENS